MYVAMVYHSSREFKAGIPCSIGAGRRGFDPRQPPTHEVCLLSAVGDFTASGGCDSAPLDQYAVEYVALAECNLNVPCESEICYLSLVAMLNREEMNLQE